MVTSIIYNLLFLWWKIIVPDKHIRQSTLDKLWNKQSGAMQMLLTILEVWIFYQFIVDDSNLKNA